MNTVDSCFLLETISRIGLKSILGQTDRQQCTDAVCQIMQLEKRRMEGRGIEANP